MSIAPADYANWHDVRTELMSEAKTGFKARVEAELAAAQGECLDELKAAFQQEERAIEHEARPLPTSSPQLLPNLPPPQLPTPRPFPPPTLDPSLFFQIDHSVHTFSGALAFEPHARDPPHARSRRPHPSPPPLSLSSVGGRVLQRAPPAARQTPLPRPTRSQLTTHARRLVCPWQFLSH